MNTPPELKILMLEDVPEEAEVLERELRKTGLAFVARRVHTKAQFSEALERFAPDLILADSKLPKFDGRTALRMARERVPSIPVVMVTGALGDEAAVELLMAGASDYVLKDRLARLGSAVLRALQEEADRRGRIAAEAERMRLECNLREAADDERRRLARELHDGLGQELTGLAMLADALAKRAGRSQLPPPGELQRLAGIARHAIESCRDIARGLSPFSAARGGLPEALRELAERACGPPGPQVILTLDLNVPLAISREAGEHLYRIAQEALTNAIKHSHALSVQISLETEADTARLRVVDDGHGLPDPLTACAGLGLRTMHDRAAAIGARLSVAAAHDRGTAVICEVPQQAALSAVSA
jgi:two-component system sensor histidine kinase UhpB